MLTSQELLERIQKNVGVPWQSQRSDGFSDGILFGNADTTVTGITTTYMPTLGVLRRAVASGKNTIICREAPFTAAVSAFLHFGEMAQLHRKKLLTSDTGRPRRPLHRPVHGDLAQCGMCWLSLSRASGKLRRMSVIQ